jgi:alpha-L-arabinofuranosidase
LGITPYISLDATPQVLGGRTPPLKGNILAERRSFATAFTAEPPTDIEAFGTIVRDLVYHVIKEKGYQVPYWGVWNEPDTPPFWKGTRDQYFQIYAASARAVRSVDPALKIGGPESAVYNPAWFEGLVRFCAEQKLPLDFVSWHYYSSNLSSFTEAGILIDTASKKYGLARPPAMIVGEWCGKASFVPRKSGPSQRALNYLLNDWNAAFMAASLIEMQRAGVVYSIYTNPVAEEDGIGWNGSGLMSSTHPWANLNVYRLWAKLKPTVVKAAYDGKPGLMSQASRDDAGNLTVLLSSLRYRKDDDRTVTVRLPGVPAGARVTEYVVDDSHSNYFDAGPEHAELETVPAELREGSVQVTMRPRSVILLLVESGAQALAQRPSR